MGDAHEERRAGLVGLAQTWPSWPAVDVGSMADALKELPFTLHLTEPDLFDVHSYKFRK